VSPPVYIALRFLLHRKRALLLSLGGVVFGVAIFIGTQAQTQGFSQYFIDSTLGSNGALTVRSRFRQKTPLSVPPKNAQAASIGRNYSEGIDDAGAIMRVSRQFSNVVACSAVLQGRLSARSGFETASAELFGVDPVFHLQATDLSQQIVRGSFDDFRNNPNSVILGYRLAGTLNITVGDTVQLLPLGGEYRRLLVAAVSRSGVSSIDSTRIYAHTRVAQTLLHKPYTASMIIYKLRDPERAPALAHQFEALFQHEAQSWQDREESTLQLFLTLRVSAAITVSLIILLAGFGIFNVLTMTVLSKVKEIAILRSMGYRRRDISYIFLWQGAMIAVAGSLIGCLLGVVVTFGISSIPIEIRGLLYANHFLVSWDWRHYVWATLLAIGSVTLASYVPARRAAQLQPVDTLRGSSL
jgi:lipoprotein-releasing system permease protein